MKACPANLKTLLSNTEISEISSTSEMTSNYIFGEYHYKIEDQKIQERVITEIPKLEVVISEILGDLEITGSEDLKKISQLDMFKKSKSPSRKGVVGHNFVASNVFLIDWFNTYQIPIIGIGCFETQIRPKIQDLYSSDKTTLTLIGRSHISEVQRMAGNYRTFVPSYDVKSHIG